MFADSHNAHRSGVAFGLGAASEDLSRSRNDRHSERMTADLPGRLGRRVLDQERIRTHVLPRRVSTLDLLDDIEKPRSTTGGH